MDHRPHAWSPWEYVSTQLGAYGPFRAGGDGSWRGTTNQGEARHRDVMETRRNLCPVEAAREMDSEGWRESEAFSQRSGFERPLRAVTSHPDEGTVRSRRMPIHAMSVGSPQSAIHARLICGG